MTVAPQIDQNVALNTVLVIWENIPASDSGDVFDCRGLDLLSIQVDATSNEIASIDGSNWLSGSLSFLANLTGGTIYPVENSSVFGSLNALPDVALIRPRNTNGVTISVAMAFRRC
jgi:hypothetical protein